MATVYTVVDRQFEGTKEITKYKAARGTGSSSLVVGEDVLKIRIIAADGTVKEVERADIALHGGLVDTFAYSNGKTTIALDATQLGDDAIAYIETFVGPELPSGL